MKPVLDEAKAFLFDCDGTIVDSMPLHHRAWQETLSKWNCDFPVELHERWAGRPTNQIVEMLNAERGLSLSPEDVARSKEEIYFSLLPQLQPIPAVIDIIRAYRGIVPFAVVSGSRRKSIARSLGQVGLAESFDLILGAEDYVKGKPDPECFLTAAAKLNVAPADCLVFEDGALGLQAAKAAAMKAIVVNPRTGRLAVDPR